MAEYLDRSESDAPMSSVSAFVGALATHCIIRTEYLTNTTLGHYHYGGMVYLFIEVNI
jgi:hypothetical protein